MTLPVDTSSIDYKFNKTLNEDVELISDEYGAFDIHMENGDYVNVTGHKSLLNACIIAIMTRYDELNNNPTYQGFGCHVHELIKDNQNKMFFFKLETYIADTLNNIRRVKTVNSVNILQTDVYQFKVEFDITSVNDEIIKGSVVL